MMTLRCPLTYAGVYDFSQFSPDRASLRPVMLFLGTVSSSVPGRASEGPGLAGSETRMERVAAGNRHGHLGKGGWLPSRGTEAERRGSLREC